MQTGCWDSLHSRHWTIPRVYTKKLVTYPRTDSRYLTSDMEDMLPELIKSLFNIFPVEDVKNVPVHAAQVINDKKVSDHHAIIPTKETLKFSLEELPKGEQAILRLVATRLFCAVGEPFRYNESVIELSDGNYVFLLRAKQRYSLDGKISLENLLIRIKRVKSSFLLLQLVRA